MSTKLRVIIFILLLVKLHASDSFHNSTNQSLFYRYFPLSNDVNIQNEDDNNDQNNRLLKNVLSGIFFFIIFITCILGNILVVLSVFTYRPLQNVQNIFIVSLALADLFVSILCMPFHIAYQMYDKWIFGNLICKFFLTADIMLCTASILHLCAIALDRYWAIKNSIKYAQKRTFKRVLLMICIIWILSAFISLPGLIWNVSPIQDNSTCDIPKDKSYRFYSSFGSFFIPLFIMTFVYIRIYMETKIRLNERAKMAKKLANSVANSTPIDTQIVVNKPKSNKINKPVKFQETKTSDEAAKPEKKNSFMLLPKRSKQKRTSIISNSSSFNESFLKKSEIETHVESLPKSSEIQRRPDTKWIPNTHNIGLTLQQRQKISLTRERRAARTLGIIMGSFTICWTPFFIIYLLESFNFEFSVHIITLFTWLGYINSSLNPIIYTVFNLDFRKSFSRLLFDCILCKKRY